MVVCSYCHQDIEIGTHRMFVRKDGRVFDLCSKKCEKNWLKLGRKPLQLKWTEAYRKFHASQNKPVEKHD